MQKSSRGEIWVCSELMLGEMKMIQKAKTIDAAAVAGLAVCMWDSHTIDELMVV